MAGADSPSPSKNHLLKRLRTCDVLLLCVCRMPPVPLQMKSVVDEQECQGLIYGSHLKQTEHKGGRNLHSSAYYSKAMDTAEAIYVEKNDH